VDLKEQTKSSRRVKVQFLFKLLRNSINDKLCFKVKKCRVFPQFLPAMAEDSMLSSLQSSQANILQLVFF